MAFNVSDIKANINKYEGPMRTSHFSVAITPPIGLTNRVNESDTGLSARDLVYLAEAAELPGISLQTTEIKQMGYGLVDKRPYKSSFVDTNIRFVEDSNADSISFFHMWLDSIAGFADRSNDGKDQMMYPDEYQTTIEVTQYDKTGEKSMICSLYKAYPLTITPIALDWASQNEAAKFLVTFAYESWNTDKIKGT